MPRSHQVPRKVARRRKPAVPSTVPSAATPRIAKPAEIPGSRPPADELEAHEPVAPPMMYLARDEELRRPARAASERATRPTGRRATTLPPLSRDQEYAFIRADLRRLLVTAGPLLVLMIGLLVVIER